MTNLPLKLSKLSSRISETRPSDFSGNNDFSEYLIEYKKNKKPKSLCSILFDNCKYIGFMFLATILLTIANLGKGSPTKPSIFHFERCSVASFSWFFCCMGLMLFTSFFGYLGIKAREIPIESSDLEITEEEEEGNKIFSKTKTNKKRNKKQKH